MKTTRLNQLYEHLDHGDLLPYQEAELRALEKGGGSAFKKIIWVVVALLIAAAIFILN